MKKFKRILSIVLAMTMVLAMGVTAFAAPVDTTLKVNAVEGHTYSAYQLLVGDLAEDGKTLSNVKWGADVADSITYKKDGADVTINPVAGEDVKQEVLDYMASLASKTTTDPAQDTANIISAWVKGNGTTIPDAGLTVKTGYYVVKDAFTDPNAEQTTTLSTVVCEVVGPTTVTPKAGTTEHKKEVLDINDTTDTAFNFDNLIGTDGWQKSADHDFGDKVPFKLTTKIASDFAKYDSYYLSINDTMEDGLTLNAESIKVYVDGELATKGTEDGQYSLSTTDHSFKVEFTKLNGNAKAAAGKDVVVVYTATLNDEAVIGNPGNKNESYAEFSNNPNGDQGGKGKTPESVAVVFTYKVDVDKVDENGDPLGNAAFELQKKIGEEWVSIKNYEGEVSATLTKFSFEGLDDGDYKLIETKTPDGYNTIEPIEFSITAVHTENGTTLTVPTGLEITFTKLDKEAGLDTDVENRSGAQLPSTGGMGTTIFYIVGAMLAVGAAVILVTKKRMNG